MENINKELLEEFILNSNVEIDLFNFIISIVLSLALALVVKITYQNISRSLNDKQHFADIFVPLAIVTTLVITVVKFSLALSLGLVGALSIVRFRAAIKEPEELVFLFFVIGIGLANGANQFFIAIFTTFILCLILYLNFFYKKKFIDKNIIKSSSNVIQIQIENNIIQISEIIKILEKNIDYLNLKSFSSENNMGQYNFWFEINPDKITDLIHSVNNLVNTKKGVKVQLFSRSGVYE